MCGAKVCTAEADARHIVAGERGGPVPVEPARIDLDRDDRIVTAKGRGDAVHQRIEFLGRDGVRGLPPPQAIRRTTPRPPSRASDQVDLLGKALEIGRDPPRAVGGARVAAAIPANLPAIGDMKIERDALVSANGSERRCHVAWAHIVAKLSRGGEAGINAGQALRADRDDSATCREAVTERAAWL